MGEFEYRGFRVRTIFEKHWRIKTWPPLHPARFMEAVAASQDEGERVCRDRATEAIDTFIDGRAAKGQPSGAPAAGR